jgi:YidC/Oxa1 family membrane protein insertase
VDRENITRMILTVALVMAIFLGWQYFNRSEPKPAEKPVATQPAVTAATPTAASVQSGQAAPEAGPAEATDLQIVSAPPADAAAHTGTLLGDSTYHGRYAMAARLTARGAGIRQIELSDFFAAVAEKEKPDHAGRKFQLVQADVGAPSFVVTRLDFVDKGKEARASYLSKGLAEAWWTAKPAKSPDEAVFELPINDKDGKPYLTLRRTYTIRPRDAAKITDRNPYLDGAAYALAMRLEFIDHQERLRSVAFTMNGPEGLATEETRGPGSDRQVVGGFADARSKVVFKSADDAGKPDNQAFPPRLDWAGATDKYFAVVAIAEPKSVEDLSGRFETARAYVAYEDAQTKSKVPGVALTSYAMPLDAADHRTEHHYLIFAGPKDDNLLDLPLYREHDLVQVIRWSGLCCFSMGYFDTLVAAIAKWMVWAIDTIAWVVQNKGLAVIFLVIVVRLLMFPISRYSQLSMLKMQDLSPLVAKLKEQYKGDTQRQQVEQMKLFREHGTNPVFGCLPMALQMPIWIALYTGIAVAISLRQAPFVLWINDLAQPDAFLKFAPVHMAGVEWVGNWAGWQFNLLPLLMIVAMFMQMKYQPQGAATSPEMEKQQKLMKYMMPLMLIFFLYQAPSALNLYILTSSLLGYAESKYIRHQFALAKLRAPKEPKTQKPRGWFGRWIDSKMEDAQRLQKAAKKSEPRWEKPKKK